LRRKGGRTPLALKKKTLVDKKGNSQTVLTKVTKVTGNSAGEFRRWGRDNRKKKKKKGPKGGGRGQPCSFAKPTPTETEGHIPTFGMKE